LPRRSSGRKAPSNRAFATLECELLDRRRFATQVEARLAVFEFIEGWYNPHRHHFALDYESPISYEKKHRSAA
jgi:putative transposase